ncbi:cobyric acid synthase CobQ [Desertifilum sp. FACHB-1129]|uniref:Cobyric acid synthase n=1 Tax=Desertifilum tharense IPPAS B-1220 TaxID=1781255 RepID=A0A1E5QGX1_9CYAN|nr:MULTISPECIES: cobyric acid synthase CobQ [Desertifilum]MDA0211941.1 cobyric acid synthase CobQ [Cyanobacteria bacterium FC1]MDI9636183.1 cobyric acid synthase CobQ [Geitlerinema splendidum]MBD2314789.1 cobyric acid synthase CobQ [Desertifilum sp. FACHB-1129]MBD2325100.1 cobyric acid synthase CobQ [Desertifilum sp. FACHB-866]MBD2335205.1 cobyric acid synthase CobQ [Desertifilum sp. FACHB-868]
MKAIMVVGTTSHAGKSLLCAALCRILGRRGWRVTPFKGQNMALNSYVTNSGGEIGYAQAVQAWAAGVAPRVEMNPILLKPQGDMTSQVIVKGKAIGRTRAADYYEQYFDLGWQAITESLQRLREEFDLIVCEGAGSPAEINLKHRDLTNMRVATYLNAATILVVDIDRGGAFAHIIGTLELLEPNERALIKGIVINKFRGQRSLLEPGIQWLEERTGIPVIGVIPWMDRNFPSEDSLDLFEQRSNRNTGEINIGVIRLPRISNFTDFDPLEAESTVNLQYISPKERLGYPDAVIIPGSKTTIADMLVLQQTGMAEAIREYVAAGGTVLGICGGFQMLGQMLADPEGVEGEEGRFKGLDLLPIKTVIAGQKIARQRVVTSNFPRAGLPVAGYEIHHGRTTLVESSTTQPLFDDSNLGLVNLNQSVWGTYLHGLFDNGPWRRTWLNRLRQQRGIAALPNGIANYRDQREALLDDLAHQIEAHLDLKPILE